MSTSIPLTLLRENLKQITVSSTVGFDSVGLIVWSKKGTPVMPLDMSLKEAKGLRTLLDAAIKALEPKRADDRDLGAKTLCGY